jgi:signal recognition particle subunit SRP19
MPDHFYIYPAYVDRESTRAEGRRVPADVAVADVAVDQIVEAAKALGFTATAEPEHQYPRQDYRFAGRVRVAKQPGVSKTEFLRRLSAELARRQARGRST